MPGKADGIEIKEQLCCNYGALDGITLSNKAV